MNITSIKIFKALRLPFLKIIDLLDLFLNPILIKFPILTVFKIKPPIFYYIIAEFNHAAQEVFVFRTKKYFTKQKALQSLHAFSPETLHNSEKVPNKNFRLQHARYLVTLNHQHKTDLISTPKTSVKNHTLIFHAG